MAELTEIRVFYAWQSDLPATTNREAIDRALEAAAKKIQTDRSTVTIVCDEATRDTSGSPNITLKILEKIEDADVLLADVTTVAYTDAKRGCPNPNVVYELGYGVGHLGWDRVILLFNENFGKFPRDLPFDFAQHRARRYKLAESDTKHGTEDLVEILTEAIATIIDKNPKRPAELLGLTRERIEHDRDVQNMTRLMSAIHLPTLDEFIADLPCKIVNPSLIYWDQFRAVAESSVFNVYDTVLKDAVDRLYKNWLVAVSHDEQYTVPLQGDVHIFHSPGDLPLPPERQRVWDDIDEAATGMREALDAMLQRLQESYVEVDIAKTSETAWTKLAKVRTE